MFSRLFLLRSLSIFLILLSAVQISSAQLFREHLKRTEPENHLFFQQVYSQPSAQPWSPKLGTSLVELNYTTGDFENYHLKQQGTGVQDLGFYTEGITQQNQLTLYAQAGFANTTHENVRNAINSDPFRVGPYSVADTSAGTFYGECYTLKGGVAFPLAKGVLGTEAFYNIKQEYQTKDPRPKNRTFDMGGKLSYSLPVLSDYNVGMGVGVGKYKQSSEVKAFESDRDDYYYSFNGFGLYNFDFSGSSSGYSRTYIGNNFGTQFFIHPTASASGWYVLVDLKKENMETEYFDSGENLYPYLYQTNQYNALLGYQFRRNGIQYFMKANLSILQSKGTERSYIEETVYYGDGYERTEWVLLTEAQRFYRDVYSGSLDALVLFEQNKWQWWAKTKMELFSFQQNYVSPKFSDDTQWWTANITAGLDRSFKKHRLAFRFDYLFKPESEVVSSTSHADNSIENYGAEDRFTLEQKVHRGSLDLKYSFDVLKNNCIPYIQGKTTLLNSNNQNSSQFQFAIGFNL